MPIYFGPAGLGGVNEALANLSTYYRLGLRACEIPFTYSIYINKKDDAVRIGNIARKLKIKLSIHAPYWINLNSGDKKKVEKSKERILKCCEVGTWLGAHRVVFHCGYYGNNREIAYENIKKRILEIKEKCKTERYTPKLAPEMMGKVNVFGGIDEIYKLSLETGCDFCIDFAHILARYKEYKFNEVFEKFRKYKELHIHFSGIEYGSLGERSHIQTKKEEWEKLISRLSSLNLTKNREIIIINESPFPVEDSLVGLEIYKKESST
ncbi:MAG: TIM barrel protein [Candidatus Pacearchaeota archaeon]